MSEWLPFPPMSEPQREAASPKLYSSIEELINWTGLDVGQLDRKDVQAAPEAVMDMDHERKTSSMNENFLPWIPMPSEVQASDGPQALSATSEIAPLLEVEMKDQFQVDQEYLLMNKTNDERPKLPDEGYTSEVTQHKPMKKARLHTQSKADQRVRDWIDEQGYAEVREAEVSTPVLQSTSISDDKRNSTLMGTRKRKQQETMSPTCETVVQPSIQYAACVLLHPQGPEQNHAGLDTSKWKWVPAETPVQPPLTLRARMPAVPGWGLRNRAPQINQKLLGIRIRKAKAPAPSPVAGGKRGGKIPAGRVEFRRRLHKNSAHFPILKLPIEVRNGVYRELLVSRKPVLVYNNWRSVLRYRKRSKESGLGLDPAILRVCYSFYIEGVHILYGENTFLYKLRDPPTKLISLAANVPRLAGNDDSEIIAGLDEQADEKDDNESIETSDEEGSEYEDETETRARHALKRRKERKRRVATDAGGNNKDEKDGEPEGKWYINIPRFFDLFRHIVIEAENNRSTYERLSQMVQAINVWISRPIQPDDFLASHHSKTGRGRPGRKGPCTATAKARAEYELAPPANIHSLTLRLSPMRTQDSFTFVDFFGEGSPLTEALKQLEIQFLFVVVKTQHLTVSPQQEAGSTAPLMLDNSKERGFRFTVNLRLHRVQRRLSSGRQDDPWADDVGPVKKVRAEGAAYSLRVIDKLGKIVEGCCTKWVEQNGIGLGDEDGWWEEYDDYLDSSFARDN